MRLDPKYFNTFLAVCAVVTAIAIIISTIHYSLKQHSTFEDKLASAELNDWSLYHYASSDSVTVEDIQTGPAVIHFWSTWSGMSMEINQKLDEMKREFPELTVIAAAARDGDEQVRDYMNSVSYDFVYLNGTPLYQDLMVPGLPSQLFLNRDGSIADKLVGSDPDKLRKKVNSLMEN